jgi:hypothetical protein
VVADAARNAASDFPFPSIEPTIGAEAWGALIGQALATTARGERPQPFRQLIPVRLWTPD